MALPPLPSPPLPSPPLPLSHGVDQALHMVAGTQRARIRYTSCSNPFVLYANFTILCLTLQQTIE